MPLTIGVTLTTSITGAQKPPSRLSKTNVDVAAVATNQNVCRAHSKPNCGPGAPAYSCDTPATVARRILWNQGDPWRNETS